MFVQLNDVEFDDMVHTVYFVYMMLRHRDHFPNRDFSRFLVVRRRFLDISRSNGKVVARILREIEACENSRICDLTDEQIRPYHNEIDRIYQVAREKFHPSTPESIAGAEEFLAKIDSNSLS